MNWELLKDFKCPKCGSSLKENYVYECIGCDFSIAKGKFINLTGNKKPLNLNAQAGKLLKYKFKKSNKWHIPDNF